MPIYEYTCDDCGLQDEKLFKSISKVPAVVNCDECAAPMRKLMSAVNHSFAHKPVGGPRPQNTGVHQIDYNYDRVIGRDADQKWKSINARNGRKDAFIRDEAKAGRKVTRDHLTQTSEGDFRVLSETERKTANAGRKTANAESLSPPPGK